MAIQMEIMETCPAPLVGERVFASELPNEQGGLRHEDASEYFSLLDPQTQEEISSVSLFGSDIQDLKPVVPETPIEVEEYFLPSPTGTPQISSPDSFVKTEDFDFDPDAFLDNFLNSPEGQAILDPETDCTTELEKFSVLDEEVVEAVVDSASATMSPMSLTPLANVEFNMATSVKELNFLSQELKFEQAFTLGPPQQWAEQSPAMDYESDESNDISNSSGDEDSSWSPSEEELSPKPSTSRGVVKKRKYQPRKKRTVEEKKERKKGQNRDAAVRYRQKKRSEMEQIKRELAEQSGRNIQLSTRVDTVREDIKYFKNLMITVLQAKVGSIGAV